MRGVVPWTVLLGTAVIGGTTLYHDTRTIRAEHVTLVYVGAKDCNPCRTWQEGAGANFRASAEFSRLTYREVNAPTLFDVLKDEYWPTELRELRDTLDKRAGVPYWFIVADGRVILTAGGLSQWASAVLPTLKSLNR